MWYGNKLYNHLRYWLDNFHNLYHMDLGGKTAHPPVVEDKLLQENTFDILQEDGDNILLE